MEGVIENNPSFDINTLNVTLGPGKADLDLKYMTISNA